MLYIDIEYLCYCNNIVMVGFDGIYLCIICVENFSVGYNYGVYVFLGFGFIFGFLLSGLGGSLGGFGGSK